MKYFSVLIASLTLTACQTIQEPQISSGTFGMPKGGAITTPHGKSWLIYTFYDLNRDCEPQGKIEIRVDAPPAHGTSETRYAKAHSAYPVGDEHRSCNKLLVDTAQLWYRANRSYLGHDKITFTATFPSGRIKTITIPISVLN